MQFLSHLSYLFNYSNSRIGEGPLNLVHGILHYLNRAIFVNYNMAMFLPSVSVGASTSYSLPEENGERS